jgi:hypothetical protein
MSSSTVDRAGAAVRVASARAPSAHALELGPESRGSCELRVNLRQMGACELIDVGGVDGARHALADVRVGDVVLHLGHGGRAWKRGAQRQGGWAPFLAAERWRRRPPTPSGRRRHGPPGDLKPSPGSLPPGSRAR